MPFDGGDEGGGGGGDALRRFGQHVALTSDMMAKADDLFRRCGEGAKRMDVARRREVAAAVKVMALAGGVLFFVDHFHYGGFAAVAASAAFFVVSCRRRWLRYKRMRAEYEGDVGFFADRHLKLRRYRAAVIEQALASAAPLREEINSDFLRWREEARRRPDYRALPLGRGDIPDP